MNTTVQRRRRRLVAWLPAAFVIVGSIVTAAGISLIPGATAAPVTATTTVSVNGTVGSSIAVSNGCVGSVTFGASFTSGGAAQVSPTCDVDFDTNNTVGAQLFQRDNDAAAPFFCADQNANGCADEGGTAFAFENKGAGEGALAADQFGIAVTAVAGDETPSTTWTADATPTAAEAIWHPIGAANDEGCRNDGPTTGTTCTFAYGGFPGAPQNSGNYTGTVLFTASTL